MSNYRTSPVIGCLKVILFWLVGFWVPFNFWSGNWMANGWIFNFKYGNCIVETRWWPFHFFYVCTGVWILDWKSNGTNLSKTGSQFVHKSNVSGILMSGFMIFTVPDKLGIQILSEFRVNRYPKKFIQILLFNKFLALFNSQLKWTLHLSAMSKGCASIVRIFKTVEHLCLAWQ
jgi:hypothetical protein